MKANASFIYQPLDIQLLFRHLLSLLLLILLLHLHFDFPDGKNISFPAVVNIS